MAGEQFVEAAGNIWKRTFNKYCEMDMYFLHFAVEFKVLCTFTEMIGPFGSKFSSFVVYPLFSRAICLFVFQIKIQL